MADFCRQCAIKFLGLDGDLNDLVGLSTPEDDANGLYPVVICEGCGAAQVDSRGTCIGDCLEAKHGR